MLNLLVLSYLSQTKYVVTPAIIISAPLSDSLVDNQSAGMLRDVEYETLIKTFFSTLNRSVQFLRRLLAATKKD